jgi:uncharacterized protein
MLLQMLVWVDIENEPQVQYLLPLVDACRRQGAEILVTARDYGATFQLLADREIDFEPVGTAYGSSKLAKVNGLLKRSRALSSVLGRGQTPQCLVCASRAGAVVARRLGIPSFVISDYEYANLTLFRWSGSTIVHPEVIDSAIYRRAGFPSGRLLPFKGLKEDITFAGIDLDEVSPAHLGEKTDQLISVLVRPPAEESHYYSQRSRELYLEALAFLARDPRVAAVLVPRYARQATDIEALHFANPPVIIDRPVPFVALLKAVDLVLCSGGTMLREAAYLGVPAYSIFASRVGAVDRYLASIGRVGLLSSAADLELVQIESSPGLNPLAGNPGLVDELASTFMALRAAGRATARPSR